MDCLMTMAAHEKCLAFSTNNSLRDKMDNLEEINKFLEM